MMSSDWSSILLSQLTNLPLLLVYVVGIILAAVFWQRHPAVSLLSTLAFSILLFGQVFGVALTLWVSAGGHDLSGQQLARLFSLLNIVRVFLGTAAWVLLLMALFGWRTVPSPPGK